MPSYRSHLIPSAKDKLRLTDCHPPSKAVTGMVDVLPRATSGSRCRHVVGGLLGGATSFFFFGPTRLHHMPH
jgi:hypothetical protein